MNCYNCLWVTSLPHRISKFVSSLLSSSSSPLIRRPRYGLAAQSVVSHDPDCSMSLEVLVIKPP